ncbi:hypothetical protein [Cereibacter sediminicola]
MNARRARAAFHLDAIVRRMLEHLKASTKLFMEFAGDRGASGAA